MMGLEFGCLIDAKHVRIRKRCDRSTRRAWTRRPTPRRRPAHLSTGWGRETRAPYLSTGWGGETRTPYLSTGWDRETRAPPPPAAGNEKIASSPSSSTTVGLSHCRRSAPNLARVQYFFKFFPPFFSPHPRSSLCRREAAPQFS